MPKADGAWKRVVALLFLGWFVIWVYRTMLTPIYDEIQRTVGPQGSAALGLISSCYFLGYVAAQIPGGMLMDRLGRRNVLVPSFAVFSVGILIVGCSRSLGSLYAGSLLAGIGTGTYYSGAFSLSTEAVPPRHKFLATALVNNGCAVGMIGGLLLGGTVVKQWGLPWQWSCFGVAALAFGTAALYRALLPQDTPKQPPPNTPGQNGAQGEGKPGALFSAKHISAYFLYFSTCYGYYMIVTWLPSYLANEKSLTGPALGLASTIVALASIPGSLLIGRLLDRFTKRKIGMLAGLQMWAALMLLCTLWMDSLPLLVLTLALYGLTGKQAVDPIIVPHITGLNTGRQLSTGLGVFNFFGMSASIFAPLVTGVLLDGMGTQRGAFYLAAALLFVSGVVFLLVNSPLSQREG